MFLIFAFSSITSFIFGIPLVILLIPPLAKLLWSRVKITVPTWGRFLLGFILFIVMMQLSPKSKSSQQSSIPTPTVTVQVVTIKPTQQPTKAPNGSLYKIISVIDGDTIQVMIDDKKETIRLIGINSPETVDPRKPVECFGKEASAFAKSKLTGKSVRLEADSSQGERDKYSRLLRYVFLEDGTNFDKLMISEGYAYEYTYNLPYKYQADFKKAQKDAELTKKGLWADNVCVTLAPQVTPTTAVTTGGSSNTGGTTVNTVAPTESSGGSRGSFTCAGKTKCGEMATCEEAKFYLTSCGVSRLDGDHDGVPCESLCN